MDLLPLLVGFQAFFLLFDEIAFALRSFCLLVPAMLRRGFSFIPGLSYLVVLDPP